MLGLGHFNGHGFDFSDVLRMGLAVKRTVCADAGDVRLDGLRCQQYAEVIRDDAAGRFEVEDAVEDEVSGGGTG